MAKRLLISLWLVACSTPAQPEVRKLPMSAMAMPLEGVHRGERALSLDVRLNGGSATEPSLERDEFVERWVSRAVGVERQWVFPHEPSGEGALEVRVELHASNTRAVGPNTEITGASGTWGIGPATWVDARGRHSPVHSRIEAGHLILVVDQGVIANSTYPAILDPVFTSLTLLRPADVVPSLIGNVVTDGVDLYTNLGPYNPDGVSTDLPLTFIGCFGPRACLVRVPGGVVRADPTTGVATGTLAATPPTSTDLTEGGFVIESTSGPLSLQYYAADGTPGALVAVHPTEPSRAFTSCSPVECIVEADDAVYNVTSAGATLLPIAAADVQTLIGIPGGGFWATRVDFQPDGTRPYVYWRTNGNLVPTGPEATAEAGAFLNGKPGQGLLLFSGLSNWTLIDAAGVTTVVPRPADVNASTRFACPEDCYFFARTVRGVPVTFRYDFATGTLTSVQPYGTDTNVHAAAVIDTAEDDSAALWADRRRDHRGTLETSLRAGRLSPTGAWIGPELTLPDGEYFSSTQPLVLARAPTAWTAMYGSLLWSFDNTGLLNGSAARLGAGVWAAASHPDGVFLVMHGSDRYFLRGVLVSGAATTLDVDLGFADTRRQLSAAISSGDGSYLVVVNAEGVRGTDLFAVRVTEGGTVLDEVPISLSAADGIPFEAQVVDDGDGWLVFWYDSREGLTVLRVQYDGTLPSPDGVVIETELSRQFAVDFDGSDTWVAYADATGVEVLRMRGLNVMSRETVPAEGSDVGLAASDAHLLLSLIADISGPSLTHITSITNDVDGALCATDDACESGFCAAGRCCDRRCDGGCEACTRAAGAEMDGVCGPAALGLVCRASTGACDLEESCDGVAPMCPPEGPPPSECLDAGVDAGAVDAGAADAGTPTDSGPMANDGAVDAEGGDASPASDASLDSAVLDGGPTPADGGCSVGHGQTPGAMLFLWLLAVGVSRRRRDSH